jgi:hypothetical protein
MVLAGFLIAKYDYLYSFLMMSLILVFSVPVFLMTVKVPSLARGV